MEKEIIVQKKGLGKGLSALIPGIETREDSPYLQLETGRIFPNPVQPRHSFDEAQIDELAASIREKGILQPLLVRPRGDGYELIAGERRLRAAVKAGLKEVPVVIREVADHEALQLALVENLQREDLNPIEEARAYQRLQEEFGAGQEEIADRVGKSRSAVANTTRLLSLPQELQEEVARGRLQAGQARALLGLERDAAMLAAGREVITKGLSTREAERLVRRLKSRGRRRREGSVLDPDLRSLIERLQRWLGTKVRLAHHPRSGKGKIEVEYYSTSDFERVIRRMMGNQS